jgi:arginine decarboxylase
MPENRSWVPRKVFFTKGVGRHRDELCSFELALRDAGIEQFNLVHVSSILPPGCAIVSPEEGLKELQPGQVVFCVMARVGSEEPGRRIAAAMGCAAPRDPAGYGYLAEHEVVGESTEEAAAYAEDLAAAMLASARGVPDDEAHRRGMRTLSVAQSAVVEAGGFTTVIAVAVFVI